MVVADDAMPDEPEDSRQRVADDRRPEVADVHLFRDVRAREVDHHRLGDSDAVDAFTVAREELAEPAGEPRVVEPEVHEPGAGDLCRGDRVVLRDLLGDPRGDLSGRLREPLAERHGGVHLVVAVRCASRSADEAGRLDAPRLADRGGREIVEKAFDAHGAANQLTGGCTARRARR